MGGEVGGTAARVAGIMGSLGMPIPLPKERIGKRFAGKYRIDRILGRGGMGVVFGAMHEWTSRPVAVKILNPEFVEDRSMAARFLREAQAAASLHHPNVVDVLDMGSDEDGAVYLVLELLDGCTLADHLADCGPLGMEETLSILMPIMSALATAHEQGSVHRDIKPENILLSQGQGGKVVPKLLDFGIAKTNDGRTFATQTGAVLGTPQYMSPEQASGARDVGPASDVWAMGMLIHECLEGKPPYQADTLMGIIANIAGAPEPKLQDPSVPPRLRAAIERANRRDLATRHKNMRVFLQHIQAALEESGFEIRPPESHVRLTESGAANGSAFVPRSYELDLPPEMMVSPTASPSTRPRPMRSERPGRMLSSIPPGLELEKVSPTIRHGAPGRYFSRPPRARTRQAGLLDRTIGQQPPWLVASVKGLLVVLGLSITYGVGLSLFRLWMRSHGG